MADAGVTGVVVKRGELAVAEATAVLRVDAEIRSLRRKLAYLQTLVVGADRQRRGRANELLLLWLRETREVAFEVEDAVDKFHLRVDAFQLRSKWRRGRWHRAAVNMLHGFAMQGESGIGKTMLARKLYNDPDIIKYFEVHAWFCLPPHIRFTDYLEIMYRQVSSQILEVPQIYNTISFASGDEEARKHKLLQLMQNRKYLVVLDGLVSISDWNSLFDVLPDNNNGSRILLTTHLNLKEINHIGSQIHPLELHCLEAIHSQQLFNQWVFGAREPPHVYKIKAYYDKVHNITAGLPLAIIVLAGVLCSKVISMECDVVFKQLESNGQPKPVTSIWSLAFDDLPHYLKSCFLYFATMSENIIVYPNRLVRLWVAEGLVAPKRAKTPEEVGFDYLRELISRGLVQVMEKDAGGGIKLVTIHNLLHAFLESEAQESGFLEIHHHANILNPNAVRCLAVHNYVDSFVHIPNAF